MSMIGRFISKAPCRISSYILFINEGRDGKKTLWKLWFFESILSAWKTFPPHLINHDEDDYDDPEDADYDDDDNDDEDDDHDP